MLTGYKPLIYGNMLYTIPIVKRKARLLNHLHQEKNLSISVKEYPVIQDSLYRRRKASKLYGSGRLMKKVDKVAATEEIRLFFHRRPNLTDNPRGAAKRLEESKERR